MKKEWLKPELMNLNVMATREEEGIETADEKYKHNEYCDKNHWPWECCNKNNKPGNMLPEQGEPIPTFS
ncbi:hypothetical protein ABFP60_07880 [Clostridioides difficile]